MKQQAYLFVDGYNMIGAWPELAKYQQDNIQLARDLLLEQLAEYGKYRQIQIVLVFDAQLVPGAATSFEQYEIQVVFTSEQETADAYIERLVRSYIHPTKRVTVATSDQAEQWMVFQQGALRQSAQELRLEIQHAKREIERDIQQFYATRVRRHSPWRNEQLVELDRLRKVLHFE